MFDFLSEFIADFLFDFGTLSFTKWCGQRIESPRPSGHVPKILAPCDFEIGVVITQERIAFAKARTSKKIQDQ